MGAPRIDRTDKNLLINGNFDYWQRGTLVSTISSYGADRWKGNSAQASQQRRDRTFSAGLPTGSLYGNQVTSLAGGNEIFQRIESARLIPYVGKYVTFSFKAGLVSGTTPLSFNIRKPTLTDNYAVSNIVLTSPSFASPSSHTGTYTTYKWTFQIDADMVAKGFAVSIQGDATVWSIIFSQLMLVVTNDSGDDLIPGNFAYGGRDELAEFRLCQRYFQLPGKGISAVATSSTNISMHYTYPTIMRTVPLGNRFTSSITFDEVGFGTRTSSNAFGSVNTSIDGFKIDMAGFTGMTAGHGGVIVTDNCIALDAEL